MHESDPRLPRHTHSCPKAALLVWALLICLLTLGGCTMAQPDLEEVASAPPQAGAMSQDEAVGEDTPQAMVMSNYVSSTSQRDLASRMSTAAISLPRSVTICYDGTYSMMGFADVHGANEYKNTLSIVDSAVAACFPGVTKQYYRLGRESEPDLLDNNAKLSAVTDLCFCLNQDMLTQPERVVIQGDKSVRRSPRMNEPIRSYYHTLGLPEPADGKETPFPASQALGFVQDNGMVVLVTDLEELQTNRALVRDIEDKVYSQDMIVGITAVESSFSGFAPIWSKGAPTWFEWGSQPTGSCELMFDCIDYEIGLTIDPDKRGAKSRPFYVLCFGNSESVNAYCLSFGSQLGDAGIGYTMSIFDAVFNPIDYALMDNVDRNLFSVSTLGVNRLQPSLDQAVGNVQLQGLPPRQAGDDKRWFSIPITYLPRLSDPRIGQFSQQDFTVVAYLQKQDANGVYGERVKIADEIATELSVENRTSGAAILNVNCAFPQNRLEKGQHLLTLEVLLNTPLEYRIPEWMADYDQTLDNDSILRLTNGSAAFDGSKTIGLANLMSAIVEYQKKTASVLSIGEFSVELNVAGP